MNPLTNKSPAPVESRATISSNARKRRARSFRTRGRPAPRRTPVAERDHRDARGGPPREGVQRVVRGRLGRVRRGNAGSIGWICFFFFRTASERDHLARLVLVREHRADAPRAHQRLDLRPEHTHDLEGRQGQRHLAVRFRRRRRRRRHQPVAVKRVARDEHPRGAAQRVRTRRLSEASSDLARVETHGVSQARAHRPLAAPCLHEARAPAGRAGLSERFETSTRAARMASLKTLPHSSSPTEPSSPALTPNPRDKPRAVFAADPPALVETETSAPAASSFESSDARVEGSTRSDPPSSPPPMARRFRRRKSEDTGGPRWSTTAMGCRAMTSTHPASARVAGDIATEAEEPGWTTARPGVCRGGRFASSRALVPRVSSRAPSVGVPTRLPGEGRTRSALVLVTRRSRAPHDDARQCPNSARRARLRGT